MQTLSDYRERYGSIYVVEVEDKFVVPFRLLTLDEYFDYNRSLNLGLIARAVIENEIFCKCVQDPVLVEEIGKQKAGTVPFVTDAILRYSVPLDTEEFNQLFNISRSAIQDLLHQSVGTICMAFPGYTPDDIYGMNIEKIMLRLALAESKLIESGFLKGPIQLETEQKKPRRPKVDLTRLKEYYEGENIKDIPQKESVSEHMTDKDGKIIISGRDMVHQIDTDHEADSPAERIMIEDAKRIYKPYLDDIRQGKKIKIKSEEEKIAEVKERMQARQKKGIKKARKG